MVDYSEDAVRDWLNQIDENEFLERVRIKRDEMNFHRWEKIWISILRFCPRKWKKSPWHSSSISVGCISCHVVLWRLKTVMICIPKPFDFVPEDLETALNASYSTSDLINGRYFSDRLEDRAYRLGRHSTYRHVPMGPALNNFILSILNSHL